MKYLSYMKLSELEEGQIGKVISYDCLERKIIDIVELGLTVGTKIKFIKYAPLGDPLEFQFRGYHLIFGKNLAEKINIEPYKKGKTENSNN